MKKILGIIGRKLGMTHVFLEDGSVVPVTVVEAGPCPVIQKKTKEKDGYNALQVGFLPKDSRKVSKPLTGHFKKAGVNPCYCIKEFRLEKMEEYEPGQEVNVSLFKPGDVVDVTGLSKGRGFAGAFATPGFMGFGLPAHEYFRTEARWACTPILPVSLKT
jgi:large subunit ribosomal protein L3